MIDLCEDSPLKKKAPKLETMGRVSTAVQQRRACGAARLQECVVAGAGALAADAHPPEQKDELMAPGAVLKHACSLPEQPSVRTSSDKAAEAGMLKGSRKGVVAEGAVAPYHGPSHQLEHVAAGTKQPLTEKLQNGPAQKHRQKQKLLGAERAVKQPTDSDVGALETVIAMGFDRTQSRIALKTCGGNANRAIEFLLNR